MQITIKNVSRLSTFILLSVIALCGCAPTKIEAPQVAEPTAPIPVKVVVVTMFEIGEDQGDKPGEFQLWKAGQKLDSQFAFPQSHHDIYMNQQTGVMGIVTGMGTAKAASAIMALGLDPRFDLTQAYWLVAGIAGFDPADASIGSAAWATWLVDGDLAHEIDAREIPADWPSGFFPMFANSPNPAPTQAEAKLNPDGLVYQLNSELTEWAYQLTKNIPLTDYPAMQTLREKYQGFPNAMKAPFVLKGDHLAASTFWHGTLLNQWANDWTRFWTNNAGNFVSSGMEDTGSLQSILYLDRAGKVDKDRVMVLRTASNYSMQPPGLTAAQNLAMESGENGYAGMRSALESAYTVGSTVVDELVNNWDKYATTTPSSAD